VTKGRLRATGLCLRKRTVDRVSRWYSEKPITLNGISIAPKDNRKVTSDLPGSGAPRIAGSAVVTATRCVENAAIGPMGLDHLVVTLDGEDLWEIKASIKLPAADPRHDLRLGLAARSGSA
jgi:hypothetical protein